MPLATMIAWIITTAVCLIAAGFLRVKIFGPAQPYRSWMYGYSYITGWMIDLTMVGSLYLIVPYAPYNVGVMFLVLGAACFMINIRRAFDRLMARYDYSAEFNSYRPKTHPMTHDDLVWLGQHGVRWAQHCI